MIVEETRIWGTGVPESASRIGRDPVRLDAPNTQ
jgi:hypothetical protein